MGIAQVYHTSCPAAALPGHAPVLSRHYLRRSGTAPGCGDLARL